MVIRAAVAAAVTALAVAPAPSPASVPAVPLELPAAGAGARAAAAQPATWLVGARETAAASALARRHGARRIVGGAFEIAAADARSFAAAQWAPTAK